jgi:hypothetical protein
MFLLLIVFRKKVGNLNEKKIIKKTWKVITASFAMVIGIQTTKYLVAYLLEAFNFSIFQYQINMYTLLGVFTQATVSLLIGLILFYLASRLLKIEELDYFLKVIKKRFYKTIK